MKERAMESHASCVNHKIDLSNGLWALTFWAGLGWAGPGSCSPIHFNESAQLTLVGIRESRALLLVRFRGLEPCRNSKTASSTLSLCFGAFRNSLE